jgi:hypothetical protein
VRQRFDNQSGGEERRQNDGEQSKRGFAFLRVHGVWGDDLKSRCDRPANPGIRTSREFRVSHQTRAGYVRRNPCGRRFDRLRTGLILWLVGLIKSYNSGAVRQGERET